MWSAPVQLRPKSFSELAIIFYAMSEHQFINRLLPKPRKISLLPGKVDLSTLQCLCADEPFLPVAGLLAARLTQGTGHHWEVKPFHSGQDTPAIVFRQVPQDHGPEAFSLRIGGNGVEISASHPAGAFYGSQTLLQMLPPAIFAAGPMPEARWEFPHVLIEDWPEFRWRGVMLDSVRHFQTPGYLKKFVDVLAQHKINILHWHLTDDQGWRVEILKYPQLTAIGSKRRESPIGHQNARLGGDGVPVEGFYSQDEIRELVAYAALRNVHLLPEIEMPGHAQAAVAAYPELGCLDAPVEVSTQWGVHEMLFNVRPETISFLQDVLAEIVELFPFEYVHVGGDEAVKTQWRHSAETQARMKELGVANEVALQSWFIGQMADFLQAHGKKLIGWDEILEGGLPASASVMSWRGEQGAVAAAAKGHDAVMCSKNAYYFNYAQSKEPLTEPLSIGGFNSLRNVYETSPVPASLTPEQVARILGVQGQLWTEYMPTTNHLEYMAFPRVCALAEIAWSDPRNLDFGGFLRRLAVHVRRLDCQGIRYRSGFDCAPAA